MKIKKTVRKIGAVAGFLAYRLLEILDGEVSSKFHVISYQKAEPLKIFALTLIEGGE